MRKVLPTDLFGVGINFWITVTESPAEELILDCSYSVGPHGQWIMKTTVTDTTFPKNYSYSYRDIFSNDFGNAFEMHGIVLSDIAETLPSQSVKNSCDGCIEISCSLRKCG